MANSLAILGEVDEVRKHILFIDGNVLNGNKHIDILKI